MCRRLPSDAERGLGSTVARQHIAEIRPAFPRLLRLRLQPLKLRQAARDFKVSGALTPIAGRVSEREIVLGIEAIFNQRVDVIDVELPFVQHEVHRVVADEAVTGLAIK